MKNCLTFILLFIGFAGFAQDEDEGEMQTLAGNSRHNGFYIAPVIKTGLLHDEPYLGIGIRMAWVMNKAVGLGLEWHGTAPLIVSETIVPGRRIRPLATYGGLFIEPVIFSDKLVHLTFPIGAGLGWAGYLNDWQNNSFNNYDDEPADEQVFWYVEPGANLEINLSRNVRFGLGASYRKTNDMKVFDNEVAGFDGMTYTVLLKFGRF